MGVCLTFSVMMAFGTLVDGLVDFAGELGMTEPSLEVVETLVTIETGEGPPSNGVLEMLGKLVDETTAESITGVQTAPGEVVTIEAGERPLSNGVLEVHVSLASIETGEVAPSNGVLEVLGKLGDDSTTDPTSGELGNGEATELRSTTTSKHGKLVDFAGELATVSAMISGECSELVGASKLGKLVDESAAGANLATESTMEEAWSCEAIVDVV